jgi:hypothetical protein
MYQNAEATGEAIRLWLGRTGTPREDLFVTSKIISVDEGVEAVCRRSLEVRAPRPGCLQVYRMRLDAGDETRLL